MNIKIKFFENNFLDSIGGGIYEIKIKKGNKEEVLYIGESVFVLVRCATHLFNLKINPNYLGFDNKTINDPKVILEFNLLYKYEDKIQRKIKEKELIKMKSPILQTGISDRMKSIEEKMKSLTTFLENSYNEKVDSRN